MSSSTTNKPTQSPSCASSFSHYILEPLRRHIIPIRTFTVKHAWELSLTLMSIFTITCFLPLVYYRNQYNQSFLSHNPEYHVLFSEKYHTWLLFTLLLMVPMILQLLLDYQHITHTTSITDPSTTSKQGNGSGDGAELTQWLARLIVICALTFPNLIILILVRLDIESIKPFVPQIQLSLFSSQQITLVGSFCCTLFGQKFASVNNNISQNNGSVSGAAKKVWSMSFEESTVLFLFTFVVGKILHFLQHSPLDRSGDGSDSTSTSIVTIISFLIVLLAVIQIITMLVYGLWSLAKRTVDFLQFRSHTDMSAFYHLLVILIFVLSDFLLVAVSKQFGDINPHYFSSDESNEEYQLVPQHKRRIFVIEALYLQIALTYFLTVIPGRAYMLSAKLKQEKLNIRLNLIRYVSHEMRTPLNTAFLGLSILNEGNEKMYRRMKRIIQKYNTVKKGDNAVNGNGNVAGGSLNLSTMIGNSSHGNGHGSGGGNNKGLTSNTLSSGDLVSRSFDFPDTTACHYPHIVSESIRDTTHPVLLSQQQQPSSLLANDSTALRVFSYDSNQGTVDSIAAVGSYDGMTAVSSVPIESHKAPPVIVPPVHTHNNIRISRTMTRPALGDDTSTPPVKTHRDQRHFIDALEKVFKLSELEDLQDTIKQVQDSCKVALQTLNDLLTFDQLDEKKLVVELEKINPWELLCEVAYPFEINAKERNVALSITCEDIDMVNMMDMDMKWPEHHYIKADRFKLSQVIRNLISNALKFTPPRGSVQVKLQQIACVGDPLTSSTAASAMHSEGVLNGRRTGGVSAMRISVIDSGVGISQENQKRLFGQYVQFNAAALQQGKGSGLGLWIAKSIVEMHRGKIAGTSLGEGFGSTFSLELPLYHKTFATPHGSVKELPPRDSSELPASSAPSLFQRVVNVWSSPWWSRNEAEPSLLNHGVLLRDATDQQDDDSVTTRGGVSGNPSPSKLNRLIHVLSPNSIFGGGDRGREKKEAPTMADRVVLNSLTSSRDSDSSSGRLFGSFLSRASVVSNPNTVRRIGKGRSRSMALASFFRSGSFYQQVYPQGYTMAAVSQGAGVGESAIDASLNSEIGEGAAISDGGGLGNYLNGCIVDDDLEQGFSRHYHHRKARGRESFSIRKSLTNLAAFGMFVRPQRKSISSETGNSFLSTEDNTLGASTGTSGRSSRQDLSSKKTSGSGSRDSEREGSGSVRIERSISQALAIINEPINENEQEGGHSDEESIACYSNYEEICEIEASPEKRPKNAIATSSAFAQQYGANGVSGEEGSMSEEVGQPLAQIATPDKGWESGLTFMLVDDAVPNRKMLRKVLTNHGHTVYDCGDGVECLQMLGYTTDLQSSTPSSVIPSIDVILMDEHMPHMNGPEATKILLQKGFPGIIYAVTGTVAGTDGAMEFLKSGAKAVFCKPLDIGALRAELNKAFK